MQTSQSCDISMHRRFILLDYIPAMTDNKTTIYFDGSCPLCSIEIDFYASRQGSNALQFVDVSQPDAKTGTDLDRQSAMARFHVRRSDGQLVSGARAFAAIWQALPRWRFIGMIASLPGITHGLELLYRLFLPIRPRLSRIASRFGATAKNPIATSACVK